MFKYAPITGTKTINITQRYFVFIFIFAIKLKLKNWIYKF